MQELWQLYDQQGRPIDGKGAAKDEIFNQGLLHGAAHVWIWQKTANNVEVLLQKRAADKRTWPELYDISAAGHIDLGEDALTAAIRETKEEIGIDIAPDDLVLINVYYAYLKAESMAIEHEFQWLYLLEIKSKSAFTLETKEVASLKWKPLDSFKNEVLSKNQSSYVPHGNVYFSTVIEALERLSNTN